ncbi:MAG TPA: OadG family transporter subunit [Candidatus Limnocylindrales bacterium]|nr:OadG family transporter subunit [Candidatus Limnocylindrales bacterium]
MSDLEFGIRITIVGMGIVFGMLILLWGLLTLAAWFEARGATAGDAAGPGDSPSDTTTTSGAAAGVAGPGDAGAPIVRIDGASGMDPRLVAAITVAVLDHAEARRLQAAPAMRSYWPGSLLFASRWVSAGRTRQSQTWRRRGR